MPGKLVALASYVNVPLAEVARLRLEQEGIPVHLENAETVNVLWHYGNAVGYVRLMVPEEHVEQARTLLRLSDATVISNDGSAQADDADVCLSCGRSMREDQDRCASCGWSYEEASGGRSPEEINTSEVPPLTVQPVLRAPKSVSQVRGWRRIAIQIWIFGGLGILLATLVAGLLSMLRF